MLLGSYEGNGTFFSGVLHACNQIAGYTVRVSLVENRKRGSKCRESCSNELLVVIHHFSGQQFIQ